MKKLAALAALLMLAASPSTAADTSHMIDFKAPILNIDGSRVDVSPTDKSPVTLGKLCEDALIANNLPNDNPNMDEKKRRFFLATKIHDGKDPLTVDEISLVLKVIGMAYGPLPVGRATELLDPAAAPKK